MRQLFGDPVSGGTRSSRGTADEHVVSGPGKDIDGSPRIWRIAVLEGARHLEEWNVDPEAWLPLFATEYDGRATLFSIRPKPGEKGLFRAIWTYADGTAVCDENGWPVPEPHVIVNNEGPDGRWLTAIGAIILFCATFDVEYTYHGDGWDFSIGC